MAKRTNYVCKIDNSNCFVFKYVKGCNKLELKCVVKMSRAHTCIYIHVLPIQRIVSPFLFFLEMLLNALSL